VSEPLVSVVTPFHNTAQYLAECIESVLAQNYARFEYILSDNCSTDGSREIAERYARRDPRIRLILQPSLLSQVQHYNCALAEISRDSYYCKIVQADDTLFPECLQRMVSAFEQSTSIGLVSAYDLKANKVRGSGFPYPASFVCGKEVARLYLRTGLFVFGSPTTVMYRSSLVRSCKAFYDESLLHEDTEKCIQILESWDFGFVHQVLSFLRVDDKSLSGGTRDLQPDALDRYIIMRRYSPVFFDAGESSRLRRRAKIDYYRALACEFLRLRGQGFWHYHRQGLRTMGETIDVPFLIVQILRELLSLATNPGATLRRAYLRAVRRLRNETPSRQDVISSEPRGMCDQDEDHSHSVHV
jgi:glycosyltransferase involved in cell wall biosynthesis